MCEIVNTKNYMEYELNELNKYLQRQQLGSAIQDPG